MPATATVDRLGPEIPEDLSTLTAAELDALLTEARAVDDPAAEITPERADQLDVVFDSIDRIMAEQTVRTEAAAAAADRVAGRRAKLTPIVPEPVVDPTAADPAPVVDPPVVDPVVTDPTPVVDPPIVTDSAVPVLTPQVIAASAVNMDALVKALTAAAGRSQAAQVTPGRRQRPTAVQLPCSIIASADVPGFQTGSQIHDIETVARAMHAKYKTLGRGSGNLHDDKVVVASLVSDYPEDRQLHNLNVDVNQSRINKAIRALTASGGIQSPFQPFRDFVTIANADRPFRDSLNMMQNVDGGTGGVRIIPPLTFADAGPQARSVADAVTNSTTLVTSATAAFGSLDQGALIVGTGIPANTYISTVVSATNVTISNAATASASGVTITVTRPGAAGLVTIAQDLAALGAAAGSSALFAGSKPPFRIPVPAAIDVPVWAVYASLGFGNMQQMAWPQLIEAWIVLMMAQWARKGETMLLDAVIADAKQLTAAAVYGGARQLVAQDLKTAALFRNLHRTKADYRLNIAMPAWVIDASTAELVLGSGYDEGFYNISTDEVIGRFDDIGFDVTAYVDSPTSVNQLMNAGVFPADGAALPAFPTTVESIIYAPESYTFIDDGVLNIGLERDAGPQISGTGPIGNVSGRGLRDSTLARTNDAILMTESFEGVVRTGIRAFAVTHTVAWNGTAAPVAASPATI